MLYAIFLLLFRLFCIVLPGWRTLQAMRAPQRELVQRWTAYWLIFAGYCLLSPLVPGPMRNSWVCMALVFLCFDYLRRSEARHASLLYETYVAPVTDRHAQLLEEIERRVNDFRSIIAGAVVEATGRLVQPLGPEDRGMANRRSFDTEPPLRQTRVSPFTQDAAGVTPIVEFPDDEDSAHDDDDDADDAQRDPNYQPPRWGSGTATGGTRAA